MIDLTELQSGLVESLQSAGKFSHLLSVDYAKIGLVGELIRLILLSCKVDELNRCIRQNKALIYGQSTTQKWFKLAKLSD